MRNRIRVRRAWPHVALTGAAMLFFWRVLFGGHVLAPGYMQRRVEPWASEVAGPLEDASRGWDSLLWDDIGQMVPWRVYAARILRSGQVPLWNPHEFCGTPFLANAQSAVLYPPNLILWLLRIDPVYFLGLSAFLHYVFAGVCTLALLRRLGANEAGSLLGALGFMFGGFMVTWTLLPTLMNTAAWLPFCILVAHRLFEAPRWALGCWLAFGLGMAFLAGHPQIFTYVALTTAAYCLARLIGVVVPPVARERIGTPLRKAAGLLWAATALGAVMWVALGRGELMAVGLAGWIAYIAIRARRVGVGRAAWERASVATCALGLATALALALPAAQALPTLELAKRGHRGIGRPTEFAWSHPWAGQPARALRVDELVTLLAPNARGTPVNDTYKPERPTDSFTEKCGFVGTAVLALAVAAPFLCRTRHAYFFAVLSAAALSIAMATPIGRAFYFHAPGAAMGGSLTRMMCVFTFSTSVLGGLGCDAVLRHLTRCDGFAAQRLLPSVMGCVIVIGTAVQLLRFGMPFNATTPRGQLYAKTETIRALAQRAGSWRVLGLTRKPEWRIGRPGRVTFPPNSAMVYGFDSANGYDSLSIGRYRPFARAVESMAVEAESLRVLRADGATATVAADDEASGGRVLRLVAEGESPRVTLAFPPPRAGVYGTLTVHFLRTPRSGTFAVSIEGEQRPMEVEGYSPVRRADEVTMEGGPWWYPDVPGRIEITLPREGEPTSGAELEIDFFILSRQPSPSANGNMVLLENVESALLRAASVRYVLSQELLGGPGRTEVATSPNTHLYEVSRAVPRAYLSTRPMRVDDDEEALHRLMRPDWSPEKETVIVAAREADWIEPRLVESVEAHYPMRLAARGPNEVRAELRPAQRSVGNYAVVTDAVYPGWHAFVGGEQRPIHAANYVFRATYLPSGERAVSFVYLPASFKVGCFISLLAATVLASVLVLDAIGRGSRIR